MTKNRIDAVIDNNTESYAYAWLERSHGYGHMNVIISLAGKNEYRRPEGCIKISSQIGGEGEQSERIYAERFGFDQRYGHGSLEELEAGVKIMRKIEKRMKEMYETYGMPKTHAEFCQRILVASGAKQLIVEPNHWANGSAMRDKEMVVVSAASAYKLEQMEKELLSFFSRKAV